MGEEAALMGKVYSSLAVSADGFMAGLHQTLERPFGDPPADEISRWAFETREENEDEWSSTVDAGAFIMGRNMFTPNRGEWDFEWRGWWGDDPPYHGPVFVLTHHPREPLTMEGGTTFTFVTEGIESALAQARAVAGDRNISIAGGAATVNQYLRAGHIEELRLHIAPVLVGAGERLFDGVPPQALELVGSRHASLVTHVTYRLPGH